MLTNKQFVEYTLKNGGCTHWLCNEKYNGYVASVKGRELVIPIDEFKRGTTVKLYTDASYDDGYDIVGSWVHDGKVYLDCCKHFKFTNEAYNFAVRNDQLAYYSVAFDTVLEC